MKYIFSINFDSTENLVSIKDSTEHYGTEIIYGIKYRSIEQLKEKIIPSIEAIIEYYKKRCDKDFQDEAN